MLRIYFLSADGRFRRRDFAVCLFALGVALVLGWLMLRTVLPFRIVSGILTFGFSWPVAALLIKRLKDQGRNPRFWAVIYLGPIALLSVLQQLELGYIWTRNGAVYPAHFWPNMLAFLAFITGTFAILDGLFLPPEHGRNEYGVDPRIYDPKRGR